MRWLACGAVALGVAACELVVGVPSSTLVPSATPAPAVARFAPVADAHVVEGKPDTNFGSAPTMEIDLSPMSEGYLRFNVSGVSGTVTGATLRLYVTNPSNNGPAVQTAANTWTEREVTWTNRPTSSEVTVSNAGAVAGEAWLEYIVTSAVTGNGTYTFRLVPEATDGIDHETRETWTSGRPELIVNTNDGTAPTTTPQPSASTTPS